MSATRAQDVLRKVSEIATERKHDLAQYSAVRDNEQDDEADAESPIFNSLQNAGSNQSNNIEPGVVQDGMELFQLEMRDLLKKFYSSDSDKADKNSVTHRVEQNQHEE